MRRRALHLVLALYAALLVGIVTIANLGGTEAMFSLVTSVPYGDKIGHFVLIGVLAMLVDLATGRHTLELGRLRLPTAPLGLFVIVFGEELSQAFLATRTFDLVDLAADIAGMVFFVALGRAVAARLPVDSPGPA